MSPTPPRFRSLPERVAILEGSGPLPRYRSPRPQHRELSQALDAYLSTTRGLPAAPRHELVSKELRDRLRALGYIE